MAIVVASWIGLLFEGRIPRVGRASAGAWWPGVPRVVLFWEIAVPDARLLSMENKKKDFMSFLYHCRLVLGFI